MSSDKYYKLLFTNKLIKENIIKKLYQVVFTNKNILGSYELKYKNQVKYITNDDTNNNREHLIGPYYIGKNALLVLFETSDTNGTKYYSLLIDRKNLKTDFTNINKDIIECYTFPINANKDLYKFTVLDGIYNRKGNTNNFIVTDILYFMNIDYTDKNKKILDKLELLNTDNFENYFKNNTKIHINNMDYTFNIYLSDTRPYYSVNQPTGCDLFESFKNKSYNYNNNDMIYNCDYENIRGMIFYQNITSSKARYLFDGMKNNKITKQISEENMNDFTSELDQNIVNEDNKKILLMKEDLENKNNSLYNLYSIGEKDNEGKSVLVGNARIICLGASIYFSNKILELKNNNKTPKLYVECYFCDKYNKWCPVKIVENYKKLKTKK